MLQGSHCVDPGQCGTRTEWQLKENHRKVWYQQVVRGDSGAGQNQDGSLKQPLVKRSAAPRAEALVERD